MFLRMVHHTIRDDETIHMVKTYDRLVLSALRGTPGCIFAALIQNIDNHHECISLTLWKSNQDADAYESSGLYIQLVNSLRPYFSESTEWKLQLNDNYSLENTPVQVEPVVTGFSNSVTGSDEIRRLKVKPYAVQIVSFSVHKAEIQAFEQLFSREIHVSYKNNKGFIDLILLRQGSEYQSISFWDETVDIQSSSEVHSINQLVKTIYTVLPGFIQRQTQHHGAIRTAASSEDIRANVYRCLTADWFNQ